jgi:hypothetical protein
VDLSDFSDRLGEGSRHEDQKKIGAVKWWRKSLKARREIQSKPALRDLPEIGNTVISICKREVERNGWTWLMNHYRYRFNRRATTDEGMRRALATED